MKNIKYGDIPFSDRQIESMMNVFGDPGDDDKGTNPSTAMLGQVIMTREGRRAARRRKKKGL